ncbi:hypothetical protein ACOMHN_034447 [Nucella lapillus]
MKDDKIKISDTPPTTTTTITTTTSSNQSTTVNELCPGIDYLTNQNNTNNITIMRVNNVSKCDQAYNLLPDYTAQQGVVYGVCDDSTSFCKMHVKDCVDNSDESFCDHPLKAGFLCSNGHVELPQSVCMEIICVMAGVSVHSGMMN